MANLLIGPGAWNWPDWTSVDGNPDNHPDIVAVLPPLPDAVTRRRWDQILASHFIEHLFLPDAKVLLHQCFNCLKPGGVLALEQPNIEYCMRVALGIIEPPEDRDVVQFGMQGLYGAQDGNPWNGHHWGYSPASLTALLVDVGFDEQKIVVSPGKYHESVRDFIIEATK